MASKKSNPIKFDLEGKADEILKRAQEKSDEHAYMFITTFVRYRELLAHQRELEKVIQEEGLMVQKEYVKGRKNLYLNPAVNAYNSTTAALDKTAQLIMKIIQEPLRDGGGEGGDAFDNF